MDLEDRKLTPEHAGFGYEELAAKYAQQVDTKNPWFILFRLRKRN